MIIDTNFIESLVSVEEKRIHTTDPLVELDSLLFKRSADDIFKELSTKYDFNVQGQAALWALNILEEGSRLDRLMTCVIHRFWKADYAVFTDREQAFHILNALAYDSVYVAYQLMKILPYLYEGLEFNEQISYIPETMRGYMLGYDTNIRQPLALSAGIYAAELAPPVVNMVSFFPIMDLLPSEVIAHNPISEALADRSYGHVQILTVGAAITDFIRMMHGVMQMITSGDKAYIDSNKDYMKRVVSALLNALTYITSSSVFYPTLTSSVGMLTMYANHLDSTGEKYTAEHYKRWLELLIPLGSTVNDQTIVSLKPC